MAFWKRRKPCASADTVARLKLAERDLAEQKRLHARALKQKSELEGALARNHLAQLMFDALSSRREGAA